MMKYLPLLLVTIALLGCESREKVSQYTLACQVFDEAMAASIQLDSDILLTNLKEKVGEKSDVYVAWVALVNFEPTDRYEAFKTVAEEEESPDWECKSMEALAHTWGN